MLFGPHGEDGKIANKRTTTRTWPTPTSAATFNRIDNFQTKGAHHAGFGSGGGGGGAQPCPAHPGAGVAGVHVGWGGSVGGGRGGAAFEPQADEPAAPPSL